MNTNSPFELLQTSLRVATGATSTLIELLQDPQKREQNFTKFQEEFNRLLQGWEDQGAQVEQEAHNFVKTILPQLNGGYAKSPQYIERGGEQTYQQPTNIQGTKLYGFVLEGTLQNLQHLCDRYLNDPSQGKTQYRPVSHHILVTFESVDSLISTELPDSEKGFFLEQEVAFWVLTMAGQQVGPVFIVERLAWFVPYIFVDSPQSLCGGREIYGFPKEIATFQIPHQDQEPNLFTLETMVLPHFSPHTQATQQQLLKVYRADVSVKSAIAKTWEDSKAAFEDIIHLLFGSDGRVEIPGLGLLVNILDYLTHEEVPMVFLKQFRDVSNSKHACYQAIIEANSKLCKFHSGRLLADQFQFSVKDFDSHPIINELGLPKAEQQVKLAFWLNFDFRIENGTEIWKAP